MKRIVIIENGSREDACIIFDNAKNAIKDFHNESVSIFGDIKNPNEGWTVIKTNI